MTPQARRQFGQWKKEFSGRSIRRLIVPHHPTPTGKILKCPACGSTQDFVLYIESHVDTPIQRIKKEDYLDRTVYLRCFAPRLHLFGRSNYSDGISEYLKDGDSLVPLEDYNPPGVGWPTCIGVLLGVMFLILFFISIYYFVTKQGQTGIALLIMSFACIFTSNVVLKRFLKL
jgi:hypothetical protein